MKHFWTFVLLSFFCRAVQIDTNDTRWDGWYLYPCCFVGEIERPVIYFIHQTKEYHLELWGIDYDNKFFFKVLPAQFMPTHVALIPDNRGISFLDKGRIRIKLFTKRSIMNIDIDSPLYDISSYFWVDKNSLCICAKQYRNYTLCHLTIAGELETIVEDKTHHLICPQKIDESLFYIKYRRDEAVCFMTTKYPTIKTIKTMDNDEMSIEERLEQLLSKKEKKDEKKHEQIRLIELDNVYMPIHLSMIKKDRGFLVDYADSDKSQFNCYYLEQNDGEWVSSKIFEFIIPHKFFVTTSEERLVEGLFPLMPKYIDNVIYFTHYYKDKLSLFAYEVHTGEIKLVYTCDRHVFLPMILGSNLLYGWSLF